VGKEQACGRASGGHVSMGAWAIWEGGLVVSLDGGEAVSIKVWGGSSCCGGDTIMGGPCQKTTNSDFSPPPPPLPVKGINVGGGMILNVDHISERAMLNC
jgi:hypothetical protein